MPDTHVSTAQAYAALNRTAEPPDAPNATAALAQALPDAWHAHARNDFEGPIFALHPEIARLRNRLRRAGARLAMMSGSGASVFALFESAEARARAQAALAGSHPISLVSHGQYQRLWWRQLGEHLDGHAWPPRSRYAR
jgi:4-diphosphocytidyl-2-C-methyl-D-erythritol kinase